MCFAIVLFKCFIHSRNSSLIECMIYSLSLQVFSELRLFLSGDKSLLFRGNLICQVSFSLLCFLIPMKKFFACGTILKYPPCSHSYGLGRREAFVFSFLSFPFVGLGTQLFVEKIWNYVEELQNRKLFGFKCQFRI